MAEPIKNKSEQAVSVFDQYANEYAGKFMDVSIYGESFDFFCRNIVIKDPRILEIACGPGNITRYLLNKRADFQILGIDLAPKMLELARTHNPEASFEKMDARNIRSLNKTFDGIMCGFCLPYLTKEETVTLIADASILLSPGGVFYLSTMEDDYEKSGYRKGSSGQEIFMHYYRASFLNSRLIENHFSILKMERIETSLTDGSKIQDLILIAKKGKSF